MELQWVKNALEALLFACGEPVTAAQLAQVLELDTDTVQRLLLDMREDMHQSVLKKDAALNV